MSEPKPELMPEAKSNREVPCFYTDHTQVTMTGFSTILTLSRNEPKGDGMVPNPVIQARVYMSPQHAQRLMEILQEQLAKLHALIKAEAEKKVS